MAISYTKLGRGISPSHRSTRQPDTTTECHEDPALRRAPLLLGCSQQPIFVDPQAAICRSSDLQTQNKSTFKMGSLIGRGPGESFQLAFHRPGFVVVQPSEGQPVVASS